MPLSWNEIRQRALRFSDTWKNESRESAERQTFWNEFFEVFGVSRRAVASYEEPVRKLSGAWGAIDLFWPGTLLVEHKSAGADLDKAQAQGMAYIRGLAGAGRMLDLPRHLVVSDFQRIALHDLDDNAESHIFPLADLYKHVRHFAFIAGYKQHRPDPEDPANIRATELMAGLHDALADGGYTGHDLRLFLTRLLFCFFADDTSIFPSDAFKLFLRDRTAPDGSDLGPKLQRLFSVLNTPETQRQANLDEDLRAFPYINGHLFEERIDFADFNTDMRRALLDACAFRWERISPAVFGSLFQGVMEPRERRQIGAHYTNEANILKLVRSLFLDDLRAEFDHIRSLRIGKDERLKSLQKHIAGLRFLDPACGCGNFLVITYRELRRLELDMLTELHARRDGVQFEMSLDDVNRLSLIDVDQMYGIEIEEFPARIAEVALWLTDHQANLELSRAFGQFYLRIPLKKSPHILVANALQTDWKTLLPPERCAYILGNPPFVGGKYQSAEQRADMASVTRGIDNAGLLDFVTGWYFKAADFMRGTQVVTAFVSTNSICQGEQVGTLWNPLFQRFGIKIHFAHRTFAWESEARGKAHVHVVIIGFAPFDVPRKTLTDYEDPVRPTQIFPANISPYLVEGSDRALTNRSKPLCDVPEIGIGNKPIDGGHYLFTPEEKRDFLRREPQAEPFFKRWYGSEEFINGIERWCLWLGDCPPDQLRKMPLALERVENVRRVRLDSKSPPTNKLAATPTRFHVENMPQGSFLVIPEVSSERRNFIPIGFLTSEDGLCSNLVKMMPNASLYHFGILSSGMHMAWMRQVAGRLESRYRYSNKLVYNNYPWPQGVTDTQRQNVETAAQAVLDARAKYPASTLADLYDPVTMPPPLVKAHNDLDRAVERCYRKDPFPNDRARVEFLFQQYETLTAPLVPAPKTKRGTKANGRPGPIPVR
jgi:hypothetical protein